MDQQKLLTEIYEHVCKIILGTGDDEKLKRLAEALMIIDKLRYRWKD